MNSMRFHTLVGPAISALAVAGLFAAQGDTTGAQYDVIVAKNIMVPMRDGVKLATDVYMPAHDGMPAPGKFPVLVSRTPYGKEPGPGSGECGAPFRPAWLCCRGAGLPRPLRIAKAHSIST